MEITKEELQKMYDEYGNLRDMAKALDVSVTTAWKMMKEAGLSTRKKKKYTIK